MKIIETIATIWKDLGYLLDFDRTGHTVDRIAREHQLRPIDCCTEMLREWLQGRGRQPATWATLIDLLKDTDINNLAESLEGMMSGRSTVEEESEVVETEGDGEEEEEEEEEEGEGVEMEGDEEEEEEEEEESVV